MLKKLLGLLLVLAVAGLVAYLMLGCLEEVPGEPSGD